VPPEDLCATLCCTSLLQVNYVVLSGLSAPELAAILGHSAQAMSTFTTLHSLLNGLVEGKGPQTSQVASSVVQAVYNRVRAVAPTNAPQVRSQCRYQHLYCLWFAACSGLQTVAKLQA